MVSIGNRIKQIRQELGLSQKEFGKIISISNGHLSAIERDKDVPSDRIIRLICTEFGISEEWIKSGVGEKNLFAKAAKNAWDNELSGLKNINNLSKQIYQNHVRYLRLVTLLAPGGAVMGNIPLENEPDLICIVNYLQYCFTKAKDEKEKLHITIKFESIFNDYIDVVSRLTADYKRVQQEMINELDKISNYNELFKSTEEVIEAGKKSEEEIEKLNKIIKLLEDLK